jgi:NAD(P)-dependent dehydrogenase (short-subunit alcohol dehydrogenase family)
MENLPGRVALVTGGGSGIGAGTVLALARRGVHTIVADINAERCADVATLAGALGVTALPLRCDVRSSDDLVAARELALREFGGIDIVMNNVGTVAHGEPLAIPAAEWARVLDVNVMSVVRSNEVFLPYLLGRGDGHIVNTASINGLFPYCFDRLPYTTSKAAVVALSEALSLYTRPRGVWITCLCPGPVATNMSSDAHWFGPRVSIQVASGLAKLNAGDVGEMVAAAIENNQFFVLTHPEVGASMVARAAEPDHYLAEAIAQLPGA